MPPLSKISEAQAELIQNEGYLLEGQVLTSEQILVLQQLQAKDENGDKFLPDDHEQLDVFLTTWGKLEFINDPTAFVVRQETLLHKSRSLQKQDEVDSLCPQGFTISAS